MEKQTTKSEEVFKNFLKKQTEYDITQYSVLNAAKVGDFIIARVRFTQNQEYDGTKVFVWKGLTESEFKILNRIDPRFDPMSKLFAVFHPTSDGWTAALDFARTFGRVYTEHRHVDKKLYEK